MADGRTNRIGVAISIGLVAVSARAAWAAPAPPSGEPLAVESTALVPLGSESLLSVTGVRGQISIETRDERELRVISRELGQNGADRPIGIWQNGQTMIVAPAPGDKGGPGFLHIEIPRRFSIAVEAAESDVAILAAGGSIDLRGKDLRVTIQGDEGSVSADLEAGTLNLLSSSEAVLKLRGTATVIAEMTGNVGIHATGGKLALSKIQGSADVDSEGSTIAAEANTGSLHIKSRNGEINATGNKGPAEFELAATPLHLKDSSGDVTVSSDGHVDFQTMSGAMHFDMSGGMVRGKGVKGGVDIVGHGTEVNVEALENGLRLAGDGIRAKLLNLAGELNVDVTNSDIGADQTGSVVAKIDRGSLSLQRATGAVQASLVGGDVHVIDVTAAVAVDLDGGDADVSWASLSGDKDSQLVNKTGRITVTFPVSGSCRVDAKTKYGRIDSALSAVKVSDDLSSAAGPVNGGSRPVVHVTANGDIHLQNAQVASGDE